MYLPIASGVWSFCHEAEKKLGAHFSPAISCGPALAEIRSVPDWIAGWYTASNTFDQM